MEDKNIKNLEELMNSLKDVESTLEGCAELRSLSWSSSD